MPSAAHCVIRRPNRAESYAQVSAMVAASNQIDETYYANVTDPTTAAATATDTANEYGLPVYVPNQEMAQAIARGETYDGVSLADLEECAATYPNGEFAWDVPTLGVKRGGPARCVAVVELRSVEPVSGGTERNVPLARATLAVGDSFQCNISEFPENAKLEAAGLIEFPPDREPTHQDVIKVMNQEQKQNAAIKIAAMTIGGGLVGNVSGKNEIGRDDMFGLGRDKMKNTAIGAAGGAALATASIYSGYLPGNMILSAGVNATMGAVVGNIITTDDEVLRVENCTDGENGNRRTKCLWGRVVTKKEMESNQRAFYHIDSRRTIVCDVDNNDRDKFTNCYDRELVDVKLEDCPDQTMESLDKKCIEQLKGSQNLYTYETDSSSYTRFVKKTNNCEDCWVAVKTAHYPDQTVSAAIIDIEDKAFGLKRSDIQNIKKADGQYANKLRGRKPDGSIYTFQGEQAEYTIADFHPMYLDATDGPMIDLGNKARLKGTLIGAGTGAAMGAFTAYEGAKAEIEDRWVAAVREYKDRLNKMYCITGGTSGRLLSWYNGTVVVQSAQAQ